MTQAQALVDRGLSKLAIFPEVLVPAVPSSVIEPLWDQFRALLPERVVAHPRGCHRRRIPNRVVFDKLVQVLASIRGRLAAGWGPCGEADVEVPSGTGE